MNKPWFRASTICPFLRFVSKFLAIQAFQTLVKRSLIYCLSTHDRSACMCLRWTIFTAVEYYDVNISFNILGSISKLFYSWCTGVRYCIWYGLEWVLTIKSEKISYDNRKVQTLNGSRPLLNKSSFIAILTPLPDLWSKRHWSTFMCTSWRALGNKFLPTSCITQKAWNKSVKTKRHNNWMVYNVWKQWGSGGDCTVQ